MLKRQSIIPFVSLVLLVTASTSFSAGGPSASTLVLPIVSEEMAKAISSLTLVVAMVELSPGPDGKPKASSVGRIPMQQAVWRIPEKSATGKPHWQDGKRDQRSSLLFPIAALKDAQDQKLQYQLTYELTVQEGGIHKKHKAVEHMPIRDGSSFTVNAPFPFELLVVDPRQLQFVGANGSGLRGVSWTVMHGKNESTAGNARQTEASAITRHVVRKGDPVTARVNFHCTGAAPVPWEGNGKDLRASGLAIVLRSPCPK